MPPKKPIRHQSHAAPANAYISPEKWSCTAAEPGSIRSELSRLGGSIEHLAKSIDVLKDRLRPVSQERGAGLDDGNGAPHSICEIGEDVRLKSGNIDNLCQLVESMTAELDI